MTFLLNLNDDLGVASDGAAEACCEVLSSSPE